MTGIIAVAGLVIFTVLVSAWNHREGRKWKRARVLSSFGQKPEEGERPGRARCQGEKDQKAQGRRGKVGSVRPEKRRAGQSFSTPGPGCGPGVLAGDMNIESAVCVMI